MPVEVLKNKQTKRLSKHCFHCSTNAFPEHIESVCVDAVEALVECTQQVNSETVGSK